MRILNIPTVTPRVILVHLQDVLIVKLSRDIMRGNTRHTVLRRQGVRWLQRGYSWSEIFRPSRGGRHQFIVIHVRPLVERRLDVYLTCCKKYGKRHERRRRDLSILIGNDA